MVDPLTGAGPADALAELAQAVDAADPDAIAVSAVIAGFDALGALANPLETLATSAVGWLIEHLGPLNDALDWTTGDPDAVRTTIQGWNDTALALDDLADRQAEALRTQVPTYLHGTSSSAPDFERAMIHRVAQIRGAGLTCAEIASEIAGAAALTATTRSVIRDMIATFVVDLLAWALPRLAVASLTCGASAVEIAIHAQANAARLLVRITGKLDELISELRVVSGRLGSLAGRFSTVLTPRIPVREVTVDTVLTGFGALLPKGGLQLAKEVAKVDTTERATTEDADAEAARRTHERLDSADHQRAEDARDRRAGPPGPAETRDWWTRRGQL